VELELRHLRLFVAVAEEGHITRAAERLGMQQPPLSQRIKAIEEELDVQLFRRKPRGVELTEAGRVFLDRARATLAHHDGAIEAARSTARGEQGRLALGVTPTAPFHPFVPMAIRAFRASYPDVSLTIDEILRVDAVERLKAGQLDACFFLASQRDVEELAIHHVLDERMVIAVPSDHPLAGRAKAPSLQEFAADPFIVFARQQGPAFYEATVSACLKAGFTPRLGQEAPRITSALSLVAAGFGVSLVPECMRSLAMNGIVYRRLNGAHAKAVLSIGIRRRDRSPVVRNFLDAMQRELREFRLSKSKSA
jgi:DNA-binding transcriptional LysR family regulator